MKKHLTAIFLLAVLQGCSDPKDKAELYLKNGKTLYQKGDYPKAKLEFKNAIQADKKQTEAYYYLALMDEQARNWSDMYANLTKTIELNPKYLEAHLKLGQLFLLSNEPEKTLEQVEIMLKISADNPEAMVLKSAYLFKKNDIAGAMSLVDNVLGKKPDYIEAIMLKAVIFSTQKNYPAALALINKALQEHPNDMALNLTKLSIHTQSNDKVAVEQDYLDLMKRFPDKLEFSYALAKHYSNNGQSDKALQLLQTTVKNNPDNLTAKLTLVDYLMAKAPEQTEKILKEYIAQYSTETEFQFRLANFYLSKNNSAKAKESLNSIVEHKQNDKDWLAAKILLARLSAQEADYKTTSAIVDEILAVNNRQFDALLLKAAIKLKDGLYDESISDLRNILKDYPESDQALVLLANAYVKKNSPELAQENFRSALNLNPANFSALMPVVSKMIKGNDLDRAEELLQKALAAKPDHAGALQGLAQIRMLKKDWAGSQKVADLIAGKPNGQSFSQYLSAKISQGQGSCADAIVKYKQVLAATPDQIDALNGIISCNEILKQRNNSLAYLEEYIKAHPDNAYPWLLKSQLLMEDKQSDNALKVISAAVNKWPKIPELYQQMAAIYATEKETGKAIEIYEKALKSIPDNTKLSLELASEYEQNLDFKNAARVYEAVIAKQPDMDIAVNNLTSLLLDNFNSKENVERAVKLTARFEKSEQPYFLDTYGWTLANAGKIDEALQVLKEVVVKMPDVAVFRYHLGVAQHKKNDDTAALAELNQALTLGEKGNSFPEKKAIEQLLNEISALKKDSVKQ
jgi:tetratricopeptide (TPR) repeat protein